MEKHYDDPKQRFSWVIDYDLPDQACHQRARAKDGLAYFEKRN
jgi:hypothetical protein